MTYKVDQTGRIDIIQNRSTRAVMWIYPTDKAEHKRVVAIIRTANKQPYLEAVYQHLTDSLFDLGIKFRNPTINEREGR